MEIVFEMNQVKKIYKMGDVDVKALDGISFKIKKGEFVIIMGPSGSGKSTTLHIMGCLDKPTSGNVYIDGVDVSKLNDKSLAKIRGEKIGFVFQQFNLLPRLTALENVELPMMYKGVPLKKRRKRAKELLELVGLGDRIITNQHNCQEGKCKELLLQGHLQMSQVIFWQMNQLGIWIQRVEKIS